MDKKKLRIIPLGGLGEIGKNMMVLEYGDDMLAIDVGLMFPQEDMLGVDLVIPDVSYLVEHRSKLRGIIITHGHEDHTGALPYVLPRLNVPIYSAPLTQGLISIKLKEHGLLDTSKLIAVQAGEKRSFGQFKVEFLHMCHSIPDALGLIITTPAGIVVHSGDFKLDYTPVDARATDFTRLAQMGGQGVLALMADSTYAEVAGYTPSEQVVGDALRHIMADAPGRVIVTTFASLISRIQQVIDAAAKYGRKVFVIGRSMNETVRIAQELGYLQSTQGVLSRLEELQRLPPNRIVLLTTGSQGEPTSALVRIANGEHKQVRILPDDTVVLSATPIPGNETLINGTIDSLFKQGAQVFYDKIAQVHVHGHGSQEELKLLINLVRPKFLVPIHGEYRHLSLHAKLAESLGIPRKNSFVLEDGDILELGQDGGEVVEKLPVGNVYVDGIGDIGHMVLRDRRALAQDGVVVVIVAIDKSSGQIVGRPELISRGFADKDEEDALMGKGRDLLARVLGRGDGHLSEASHVQGKVRESLSRLFYDETKRRPMILPMTVMV
ncbi:MAG: ribonuclease J [Chloroflexi bacterium]|nr:ribonuclease J [Chloroflexota bacterium]